MINFGFLLNVDIISGILVIIILLAFVLKNKKKISLWKIAYPFLYMILYRTKYGLKIMDKIATKYREFIRFLGFCFIGFGFAFMIFGTYAIVKTMVLFFITPTKVDTGMALVLPGMNLPGFGILSFWHWIIAIFLLAIVHEGAHGVMARAHNIKIKSSGFAFFSIFVPLLPAAFVEPDDKMLKKQSDYVQYSVYASGPMINILIAFLLIFALPWVNPMNIAGDNLAPYEDYFSDSNGFSVNIMPHLPAHNASMRDGMIIQSVNGVVVKDYLDFYKKMQGVKPGNEITLGAENDDGKKEYTFTTIEHPDIPGKGYIGVIGLRNERLIKQEHNISGQIFYWVKGFFIWFYLFNLALGLINLLPLGIVDGGRMLQVLLNRLFKNKKRAQEYWVWISFLLLALLLIGMLAHYLKSWGFF